MGLNPGYYFRSFLLNLHFYLAYIKTDSKAPSVGTLFTWPKLALVGNGFFLIFQDLKAQPFSISLKTKIVDITLQCFAFLQQVNFLANDLNFHRR